MAETRRLIKVFIASPGDLADERKIAKSVVDEFNSQWAEVLGYQVELIGWEDTLPGVGRPQELINRDLDGCDLFVGMIWKRWGSPPGHDLYTSGFEEEFHRSLERNQLEGRPHINLLFKELDASLLADPGEQLKDVLSFKARIEAERKVLFKNFGSATDFGVLFLRCVQNYVAQQWRNANEKDQDRSQSPLREDSGNSAEAALTTPLSREGVKFLRAFVVKAERASDENPLEAREVARLRLLSMISGVHGNDERVLGAHDANLLFKSRSQFEFGNKELHGLVGAGLQNIKNENVPLWHWLLKLGGKWRLLTTLSIIGPKSHRLGAINCMKLVSEPIAEESGITRRDVLNAWFSDRTDSKLRLAAIEYLSEYGQPDDIHTLEEELSRNETQTASQAANAIIRIRLKDDRRQALEALYRLQPEFVEKVTLNQIFCNDSEFDNQLIKQGLLHQSSSTRLAVVKLLIRRHELSMAEAETLLADSNAQVRLEALTTLVAGGKSYSLGEARGILVKSNANATSGIRTDSDGEEALALYTEKHYNRLDLAALEEIAKAEIFDQDAFFALARRRYKTYWKDLRDAVLDGFADRFERAMDDMARRYGLITETLEKTRSLGQYLRKRFTRQGLNLICGSMDAADLPLVREVLAREETEYCSVDAEYLAKFGQWRDIPLIISSLARPEYSRGVSSLLSLSRSNKFKESGRAIYQLGKHRLEDLLRLAMPADLLAEVLMVIPDTSWRQLSRGILLSLCDSEKESVRKRTVIRIIHAFPRGEVSAFFDEYLTNESIYYNVIHWLDFGTSVPRDRLARAKISALAV